MAKTMYLTGGTNGAGKTKFTKDYLLAGNQEIEFVNFDEIAAVIANISSTNTNIGSKSMAILNKKLMDVLSQEKSFVYETTLSGLFFVRVMNMAKKCGYEISLYYFLISNPELAISRVQKRVEQGGHDIPDRDNAIRRHFAESGKKFWETSDSVSEWNIYDSESGTYELVARQNRDRCLEVKDEQKFATFQKFRQAQVGC